MCRILLKLLHPLTISCFFMALCVPIKKRACVLARPQIEEKNVSLTGGLCILAQPWRCGSPASVRVLHKRYYRALCELLTKPKVINFLRSLQLSTKKFPGGEPTHHTNHPRPLQHYQTGQNLPRKPQHLCSVFPHLHTVRRVSWHRTPIYLSSTMTVLYIFGYLLLGVRQTPSQNRTRHTCETSMTSFIPAHCTSSYVRM